MNQESAENFVGAQKKDRKFKGNTWVLESKLSELKGSASEGSEAIDEAAEELLCANGFSDEEAYFLGLAVWEMAINAIVYGNLDLKKEAGKPNLNDYMEEIGRRERLPENQSKKVTIHFEFNKKEDGVEAVITISDEGKGFDRNAVLSPIAGENVLSESGRGVFLGERACDTVSYEGNKVVLTKKHKTETA